MNENLLADFTLKGRVAVVTGAASGIGRETARVLSEGGARVVLADINVEGLESTRALITGQGGEASIQRTDLANRGEIDSLADTSVNEFGQLDIWVNAAGILIHMPMLQADQANTERLLNINMMGTYWACIAAAGAMKRKRCGSIINISSTGADMAPPGLSAYSMSKAAVNMITRSAATEFGALGIRVNAIAPGFIDTPMVSYAFCDERGEIDPAKRTEMIKARAQGSPLGITGVPRDIALGIYYLACDASRYMTGQVLRPNGGVIMP